MRHRRETLKLGRTSSHRKAMFRNMVTSLFKYDRIRTTDVKAKELRRWADQLVTLAKRGDLHARRIALSIIRERDVVQKLFDEAQNRYGAVSGGYTRVVKVGRRPGDAAPVSIVELITEADVKKKDEKKPKKTAKKAAKPAKSAADKPKATKKKASKAKTAPEAAEKEAPEAEAAPKATKKKASKAKTAPEEAEKEAPEAEAAPEEAEKEAPEAEAAPEAAPEKPAAEEAEKKEE